MAKTRQTVRVGSTSRAIEALSRRVTALERRLARNSPAGSGGDDPAGPVGSAAASRIATGTAEATPAARSEAIREFHQQAWRIVCNRNPQLREALRRDRERLNEFLEARGFEPEPDLAD
jgi:uncharacterized membrane protein YccC